MNQDNNPLNTHTHDGKIDTSQLPDLILMKDLTLSQKMERGVDLINNAKMIPINPIAISYLENIVASMGTSLNIDNTNGLIADDLICMSWVYRNNYDFMLVLETQLLDMATGFCPQGRTHRLFQTLAAFV